MADEITKENLLALCAFAALGGACCAPRPGSNVLTEVKFGGPGKVTVSGQQMEALYRAGYLLAAPGTRSMVLADNDAIGEVRADHEWSVSPAGWVEINRAIDDQSGRLFQGWVANKVI